MKKVTIIGIILILCITAFSQQTTIICTKCNGSGKCILCHGRTTIKCESCEGNGIALYQSQYGSGNDKCSGCNGTGREECYECDGSGVCTWCNGSGNLIVQQSNVSESQSTIEQSQEASLPIKSTFTDVRDGKTYNAVQIGTQIWMAENMAYKPKNGLYAAPYNDIQNIKTYGYLYTWNTAVKICPQGWHLPSNIEWVILSEYVDDYCSPLKETGTAYWTSSNEATNSTGFTAIPANCIFDDGTSFSIDKPWALWWSSTEYSANEAKFVAISFDSKYFNVSKPGDDVAFQQSKSSKFSVRCVKD